jgi:hypothetical protein
MSTANDSPTVRRARELFTLQKWPHVDHDLRTMWARSDLDYDDGLVLFSIAHQDHYLGSGSWKGYQQTQDERLGLCPTFGSIASMVVCTSALFAMTSSSTHHTSTPQLPFTQLWPDSVSPVPNAFLKARATKESPRKVLPAAPNALA